MITRRLLLVALLDACSRATSTEPRGFDGPTPLPATQTGINGFESSLPRPSPTPMPTTVLTDSDVGVNSGDGSNAPYNCEANSAYCDTEWTQSKKTWCGSVGYPCTSSSDRRRSSTDTRRRRTETAAPVAATTAPYDCRAGVAECQTGWSDAKKIYCTGEGRPCARDKSQPQYDCKAGWFNCVDGWSDAKKEWCDTNGKSCGEDDLNDYHFTVHPCSIGGGMDNVVATRMMTLYAAKVACARSADCAGFYHRGNPSDGLNEMIFKSAFICHRGTRSAPYTSYMRHAGPEYPVWHPCIWMYHGACDHSYSWLYNPNPSHQQRIFFWWPVMVLVLICCCVFCCVTVTTVICRSNQESRGFQMVEADIAETEADPDCQYCGGSGADWLGRLCMCRYGGDAVWSPGLYVTMLNTSVKSTMHRWNFEIGVIEPGQMVDVVETMYIRNAHRIRGRIEQPIEGWITLLDTADGTRFCVPKSAYKGPLDPDDDQASKRGCMGTLGIGECA